MKKKHILINTVLSTLAIPSIINFLIYHNAKNKADKSEGSYYNWKYGRMFYTVKGSGKPLLLVHGICAGCNSFEWNRNADILSKYYTVYTIDLIGFGKSDKPNMTYTAYIFSQLILNFIEEVIKSPVNIIANSLSAAFTIMACNLSPKLFSKVLLISPSGIGETNTQFKKTDRYLKFLLNSPIIGTSLFTYVTSKKNCETFLIEKLFYNENNITDEILNNFYTSSHGKNTKYAISSYRSNYMNVNIETALSHVDLPIYIIWGKNAQLSPLSNLELIKDLSPNIQYAIFDQTKMLPHCENPREFNKICREFFE